MNPDFRRFLRENPDRLRDHPADGALFAGLLRRLRAMPRPEPRDDFAARVMERLRREEAAAAAARRHRPLRWAARIAAAAAIALLCAAGLRPWLRAPDGPAADRLARTAAACDLILSEQGTDGAWRAAVPAQDGALSAIALLALVRNDPDPLAGPRAEAVRGGMDHLVALQARPQGAGDGGTDLGRSSRYLVSMALRSGAALPGAPAAWKTAADRAAADAPPSAETARLNRLLAHSATMPEAWKVSGGPVLAASLELLQPRTL